MNTRLTIILLLALPVLSFFHFNNGFMDIDILQTILTARNFTEIELLILQEIRLPRLLLLVFIGFGLGISGAAIQGHVRNPLAEPALLGISSSAAVFSVLAFYFGLSHYSIIIQPIMGVTGSIMAALLLVSISARGYSTVTLILLGVALNAFSGSLISLLINFAPNPFAIGEIVFWLLGSVTNRSLADAWLVLPFTIAGSILIMQTRPWLNALTLGHEIAVSMGHDNRKNEVRIILGTALCVGAGVSVAGIIGFVGLVVPHIVRPWVKHMPGDSLFLSGLLGACALLVSDLIVKLASGAYDIKLGVVTALVGAPFFFYIALKSADSNHA